MEAAAFKFPLKKERALHSLARYDVALCAFGVLTTPIRSLHSAVRTKGLIYNRIDATRMKLRKLSASLSHRRPIVCWSPANAFS